MTLPPAPPPNIPIIDLQTGRPTREWYEWFKLLEKALRDLQGTA